MITNELESKLENLNVAIVTHVYATGPAQELEDFLKNRVRTLVFIGHPFKYAQDTRSFYKIYRKGVLECERHAFNYHFPGISLYFKDIFLTLLWLVFRREKFDLYVGADPLNGLAGFILKITGKVKRTVLYTVDYIPNRFSNKALNRVYHGLDSFCVRNSDFVWNLSARMAEERKKKGILHIDNQSVVPIGVNFDRIKRKRHDQIDRFCLVYMGHVKKHQGLELVIESLKTIIQLIPTIKLMIVGGGELEGYLKDLVAKNDLGKYVEFKGYIPDHRDVENILCGCAVGLALYEPNPYSITWYADPSKPKQYMACGLPVITTSVPWISKEIEKNKCGIVVDYTKQDFINAVVALIDDEKRLNEYRENAVRYIERFDWNYIFSICLGRLWSIEK